MEMNEFGLALAGLRKSRGDSPRKMAARLLTTGKTLGYFSAGQQAVPYGLISQISSVYGLSGDERRALMKAAASSAAPPARRTRGRRPKPLLTEFGRLLRKIRLSHADTMANAGKKLKISGAYVSILEQGKGSAGQRIVNKIADAYALDGLEREELARAAMLTRDAVRIPVKELPLAKKEMTFRLANAISHLDEKEVFLIRGVLDGADRRGSRSHED